MTDYFAMTSTKSKLHIQFTGEVLNMHIDKLYDLDADPNNVVRIMVNVAGLGTRTIYNVW